MTLTYVDSGVLIYAAKGNPDAAALALPFLQDPNREFVTSEFVFLEVLPKATFYQQLLELEFYRTFFLNQRTIPPSAALLQYALDEACSTGISGFDAVHIACAVFGGAEHLITSERPGKPIHRTKKIKVISIFESD